MSFGLGAWLLGVQNNLNAGDSPQPESNAAPYWRQSVYSPIEVRLDRRRQANNIWGRWVADGKPQDGKLAMLGARRKILAEEKPVWEWDDIVRRDGSKDTILRMTPTDMHDTGRATAGAG